MSILSQKYNIPQDTVKKMIKDGVISCSWYSYDQVFKLWNEGKTIPDIAVETHMSERNVRYILKKAM